MRCRALQPRFVLYDYHPLLVLNWNPSHQRKLVVVDKNKSHQCKLVVGCKNMTYPRKLMVNESHYPPLCD